MNDTDNRYSSRGSLWHRWDLHLHTPASFDYEDNSVTNHQIVDFLVETGIRVVAITDHHRMDVARIRELQNLGKGKLTVLPGIEFRSDQGGEPIHYVSIFPEDCNLDHVWTTLQGSLGLTDVAIRQKGGDDSVYTPIEDGAKVTRELEGVVSIHAGAKSNSIEGISNKEQFQCRLKLNITVNHVDLMEIGQLRDIDRHYKKIFPATGLDKPLILCSDNHRITNYSTKAPLWLRSDPTFRGLLMVLREPRERIHIGDYPPDLARVEQNRTKYVRRISFQRKDTAPPSEQWFAGTIEFNPGLIAIVGNKGSGKSALADMLGLLGATKNGDAFSFLSRERFRHPTSALASHFDATLEWESGDTTTKCLSDAIKEEEVERLKYLPQDHVENVCNELAGLGEEEGFEQELKTVIFSHVPDHERLGHSTLDELVRFQTGEKQKRIDSLIKQLRELSRTRAQLEAQADPTAKRELIEKINRRRLELEAHDKVKPGEVPSPNAGGNTPAPDFALLEELSAAEESKSSLADQIAKAGEALSAAERRHAVAKRLLEKLGNFENEFVVFKASLEEDATELGLTPGQLVALTITRSKTESIRDSATTDATTARGRLDATVPPGLRKQMEVSEEKIAELQSKLDAPHRAHQAYLKALQEWQTKRAEIEGTDTKAESLKWLQCSLAALTAR